MSGQGDKLTIFLCILMKGETNSRSHPLALVQVDIGVVELIIICVLNHMISHNCCHLFRIPNES